MPPALRPDLKDNRLGEFRLGTLWGLELSTPAFDWGGEDGVHRRCVALRVVVAAAAASDNLSGDGSYVLHVDPLGNTPPPAKACAMTRAVGRGTAGPRDDE